MSIFSKIGIGGGDLLGIDIGTAAIKAVELRGSKAKGFTLSNYAIIEALDGMERQNAAIQSSSLKLLDSDIVAYLRLLKSKAGFRYKKAVASLPAFIGFSTLIELPVSSDKEINQTVAFQAKNYIPLPISTVSLDWLKVGEKVAPDGTKKQQVLLISIPNATIEKYAEIFLEAGLELDALELEQISSARILSLSSKTPKLIIDIGGRSTALAVAKEGNLKYASQADFSGGSITQALAQALNINPSRAEDLKRSTPLESEGAQLELSTIMLPIIDAILSEAKRALGNFEKSYNEKIDGVILSGSGSLIKGLAQYVSHSLNLTTALADPLKSIAHPSQIEPLGKELGPTLAVAIGLALKNA